MAIAANSNFKLASVDIRAAFLQSRNLDRDVFMLPTLDIIQLGVIWNPKKPLYSLALSKGSNEADRIEGN